MGIMASGLHILVCRLQGTHGRELDGWGYRHGSGIVDLYCDACGAKFGTVPLEDFEHADEVFVAIGY